mmetsp:Transcript_39419/g.93425  ORF Transcript_39419/g.93425 Transcript_39419/m.93425 type:complete len:210 (+) Transcript_39419:1346-1975(+)
MRQACRREGDEGAARREEKGRRKEPSENCRYQAAGRQGNHHDHRHAAAQGARGRHGEVQVLVCAKPERRLASRGRGGALPRDPCDHEQAHRGGLEVHQRPDRRFLRRARRLPPRDREAGEASGGGQAAAPGVVHGELRQPPVEPEAAGAAGARCGQRPPREGPSPRAQVVMRRAINRRVRGAGLLSLLMLLRASAWGAAGPQCAIGISK